ncbi:MAG TPA: hypothetical protein VFI62_15755 [Burkholderiales bacterium]|nr:hypothetical protein [Burkholderiales bacterium]
MFKAAIVALLAGNAVYFVLTGATTKALDACAWLALLVLFEVEIRFAERLRQARARFALRTARLAAAALVVGAALGYVFDDNLLDAINSAVWIAVVVLLEIQTRYPQSVARGRMTYTVLAASLYGALGMLVLVWAWRAEWFDAYDALLWIVAFAIIEFNAMAMARAVVVKPG